MNADINWRMASESLKKQIADDELDSRSKCGLLWLKIWILLLTVCIILRIFLQAASTVSFIQGSNTVESLYHAQRRNATRSKNMLQNYRL